ncbi:MAG TPA: SulP family inorganic anion transporter [Rariglobus sp.]|nr:SulP family inorganic anion transporter [Rariglobus sp.]
MTDLMAGITVGIVALSLCIGLGIAAGVTPQAGLYTGIIGGFIISALGGSRVQIGGPAGAFVGLVALLGVKLGLPALLVCTMMAGVILFLMGAFKLGSIIKFIPQPVTMGFTCGIAITIMSTQVRPLLGLTMAGEPAEFLPKVIALTKAFPTVDWHTVVLGLISLTVIVGWPAKWGRRVPGSIVAVIAGMLAVSLFHWPVETIGSKYGGIPEGLPKLAVPVVNWRMLADLIVPAFTIAMLGSIESLLSAVVADGLIDDRHDSNQELMAQGVANFVVPFFGGIPVTGVIARTAMNIRCGGGSPVAGIIHAVFLTGVLLVAAPLAADIPLVSLAAVLMVVAVRMGEWDEFRMIKRRPQGDVLVFLTTFALTVCFDLTKAVGIGMILAAGLFVKRVAETTQVQAMTGDQSEPGNARIKDLPADVVVYRVFGALLFGAADKLDTVLRRAGGGVNVIILHMTAVTSMDTTALDRLEDLHAKLHRHGRHLILCGPHTQPYFMMEKAGFLDAVGADNVVGDIDAAVARAKTLSSVKS